MRHSDATWEKRGLVFSPRGRVPWAVHSALQPTPVLLDEGTIRVFVGLRDEAGTSRVGFVDVDAADPSAVLGVSEEPVLDRGGEYTFDEHGVVPCAVVDRAGELYLYYAGYRRGTDPRFTVFGGLAVSRDRGRSFERVSRVPVLDRTDGELLFRVLHSILFEGGVWRVWYGAGSRFARGSDGKSLPVYDIRYMESPDGRTFPRHGRTCLTLRGDEYRVGRPYVIRAGSAYQMYFCAGSERTGYRLAYAESPDGVAWDRRDEDLGLDVSPAGWDSEMMAYPAVVRAPGGTYLFYNGNKYGYDGFGYAVRRSSP